MVLAAFLFMKRMAEVTDISVVDARAARFRREGPGRLGGDPHPSIPRGVEVLRDHGPFFFGAADKFKSALGEVSGSRRCSSSACERARDRLDGHDGAPRPRAPDPRGRDAPPPRRGAGPAVRPVAGRTDRQIGAGPRHPGSISAGAAQRSSPELARHPDPATLRLMDATQLLADVQGGRTAALARRFRLSRRAPRVRGAAGAAHPSAGTGFDGSASPGPRVPEVDAHGAPGGRLPRAGAPVAVVAVDPTSPFTGGPSW